MTKYIFEISASSWFYYKETTTFLVIIKHLYILNYGFYAYNFICMNWF